ncbi:MAG: type I-E CRISPR-associated protein Cas7/Cse4/CasC [Thermodesulfobacteriota bacterium]
MNKKFLNLHVLISHSPSCLNRDDMNMQKSAVFGGVRRIRISSQCIKRAIRRMWKTNGIATSLRSTITIDEMIKKLGEKYEKIGLYMAAMLEGKTDIKDIKNKKLDKNGRITTQIIPLESEEMAIIERALREAVDKKNDTEIINKIKEVLGSLERLPTSDIAMFGRMASTTLLDEVEAATSVAHVITTHKVDSEIDWFTAMDDLREEAEESGAGHLNTQEFGSGVFYRYACVDIDLLAENLGKPRTKALAFAADFAGLFATVVPTGKQKSFASYTVADYVLASFSDMPLSAANAFEKPVSSRNGLMDPSVKAFEEYWTKVHTGYGLKEDHAVFSLVGSLLTEQKDTLPVLVDWIKNQE